MQNVLGSKARFEASAEPRGDLVGHGYIFEVLWFYQLSWEAEVYSVSPLSEGMHELCGVWLYS